MAREVQRRKWAEQRAFYRARLEALFDFDDRLCREWNPLLRDLDPLLRLGKARPKADAEPGLPVRPGLYHWIRENDSAPPTVQPITGADGESYMEPSSAVLEDLRRCDLQNPAIFRALLERRARVEAAEERELEEARVERQAELAERWRAVSGTQVLMSPDVRWGQNAKGATKAPRKRP